MPGSLADDERLATVVVCDRDGTLLGQLEPIRVRPQYWPETGPVVDALRERDGFEVRILRLLTTNGGYAGGPVGYLAELVTGSPQTDPVDDALATATSSDPTHRLWWAQPGGLDWVEGWVDAALDARGRRRTGPLRQSKTWNLSTLLTADTGQGQVWLKATPPFLADEHGVMARVARVDPDLVPLVLDRDVARRAVLLDHVGGEDQWGLTDREVIAAMLSRWATVQVALADDVDHLLALGAADLRRESLCPQVEALVGRASVVGALSPGEQRALDRLVETLPERYAALAACGLPDTVVHGDLHPGNWRREGDNLTLLDWGDVAVGNPVIDTRAFVERLAEAGLRDWTAQRWAHEWRDRVPGSDPVHAAALTGPLAQLAAAVAYQRFLDHIEETERVYHVHDPAERLRLAIAEDL